MMKKMHVYRDGNDNIRLVEMCGGVASSGKTVRGEIGESDDLDVIINSIRNLDAKLQWNGFEVSFALPLGCIKTGSVLYESEQRKVLEFIATLEKPV